jgi:curved DNA-binding protein CbpA
MSKIEFDFNDLKYNLYEVLNVSPTSDESKIKKTVTKLIKTFHPDKNSELEEDIYSHIMFAYQILLNKDTRKKYDNYLDNKSLSFHELKETFNKQDKNDTKPKESADINLFNAKLEELNKKHGYTNNNEKSIMDTFNKVKNSRNSDINIVKEDIRDAKDFNNKFVNNKLEGKYNDQIVEWNGGPSELSTYVSGTNYTNLADMDKLYIEDTIQTSKFSSLDRAFSLQPLSCEKKDALELITTEEKIKNYQNQSTQYKNMKPSEYTNKKYSEL